MTLESIRVCSAGWICLVSLLVAGCSGGRGLPERAPVHGIVTLDGQPLPRGDVLFVPNAGPSASGTIEADGRYELTTDPSGAKGDGAVVGLHRIRVRARTPGEPGEPTQSLIPQKYGDEARSGLTAEIVAGEDNEINLELSSS